MNRTLLSETERKNKLFDAWSEHLDLIHKKLNESGEEVIFEYIFEGAVSISHLSKNRMNLHFEDGQSIRHFPITTQISESSCRLDSNYMILGKYKGKWWPLEIISIGSFIDFKEESFHVSFNGNLMDVPEPHPQYH